MSILGQMQSIYNENSKEVNMAEIFLMPRIVRIKDAPTYLGTNINYFNQYIRPYLTELRIGEKGVGFDRLDLDRLVDDYVKEHGRHAN